MRERSLTLLAVGAISLYGLWLLRSHDAHQGQGDIVMAPIADSISSEKIPLVTGEEPMSVIFTQAGCPVCHAIPGIPNSNGRVGPRLNLGTTGMQRIRHPDYGGEAKTVHDYVVESVLEPGRFVVPGYPKETMPSWYGSKLSALALERIAEYLERQVE